MPANSTSILWLDSLDHLDQHLVGRQAVHLAHINQALKYKQSGFCISNKVFDQVLNHNQIDKLIDEQLHNASVMDVPALTRLYQQVSNLINKAEIPEKLIYEIVQAYNKLGANRTIIIRPSVGEHVLPESILSSYHDEPIVTSGDANVFLNIKRVWSLLYHPDAIIFRYKHRTKLATVSLILQSIPHPQISGSIYTCDPVTQDKNKTIVEAVWGLPTSLLTGEITPDNYVLTNQPPDIYSQSISIQRFQTEYVNHSLSKKKVPNSHINQPKVPKQLLEKLQQTGKNLQNYFYIPQQINWLYGDSQLMIIDSSNIDVPLVSKPRINVQLNQDTLPVLMGTPVSSGIVAGRVVILSPNSDLKVIKSGDIVVTKTLSTKWLPVLKKIGGLIAEQGGLTAHTAVIAREYGTPCIVGAVEATKKLKQHQIITLKATSGEVFSGGLPIKSSPQLIQHSFQGLTHTNTAIYGVLNANSSVDSVNKYQIDGLVYNFTHRDHPEQLANEISIIEKLSRSIGNRPLLLLLQEISTEDEMNLTDLVPQLKVISILLRKGLTNIQIVLPSVRHSRQLIDFHKLLFKHALARSSHLKIWTQFNTPASLLNSQSFDLSQTDGVFIQLEELAKYCLGINKTAFNHISPVDPAVIECIKKLTTRTSHLKIPVNVQLKALYQESVTKLVGTDISMFSIDLALTSVAREEAAHANSRSVEIKHNME